MKEFEKWDDGYERTKNRISHSYCRAKGWRAALEWIEDLYQKYDMEDWDTVACNIRRDVKKELNVTSEKRC